jgi:hypothetical protein
MKKPRVMIVEILVERQYVKTSNEQVRFVFG